MAILADFAFYFLFVSASVASTDAASNVRSAERLAVESLGKCQFALAPIVARNLNPEIRTTFQLAWYNRQPRSVTSSHLNADSVRWRWEGEIWRDEIAQFPAQECDKRLLAESQHPPELISSWFSHYSSDYYSLPESAQRTLRQLKFSALAKNDKTLPKLPVYAAKPKPDLAQCELRALEWLEGADKDISDWLLRCSDAVSPMIGLARVRGADRLPKSEANHRKLLQLYRWAERDFKDEPRLSSLIQYRIALVAALRPEETDVFFRAAIPAARNENLLPVFREIVHAEICERIGTANEHDNARVLRASFSDSRTILDEIVLPCLEKKEWAVSKRMVALRLARFLRDSLNSKREGLYFEGKLLRLALQISRSEAVRFSQRLAASGTGFEFQKSEAFWKSVGGSPSPWAKDAIEVYRRQGRWTQFDEARFQLHRRSKSVKAEGPAHVGGVKVREEETKSVGVLRLSELRPLPAFEPKVDPQLDFAQVFLDMVEQRR